MTCLIIGHNGQLGTDCMAVLGEKAVGVDFPEIDISNRFQSLEESEAPDPVSEYGKSKLAGEQAVLESGANAAILRTAWLYGANGKNFLKTMLRLTL